MTHVLVKKAHEEETAEAEDTDSEKDADSEEEKETSKEEEKETSKEEETALKEEETEKVNETAVAAAEEALKKEALTMVAVPPASASFYGPGGCVTTYKGPSGTCIMETACEGESMADFTYGLMCVDGKGERVRHVFMGDAFDPVETFDTLIQCDLCLGLDSAGSVGLGQEVGALKDEVKALAEKVEKLEGGDSKAPEGNSTANASMLIHTGLKLSKTKAKNDEDSTPAPAAAAEAPKSEAAAADVEVDVIHHNHETKFLKSNKRVTLSSHSDWDPLSARLNQPPGKRRAQRPGPNARLSK